VIGNEVKSIGSNAFSGCSDLYSVTFGKGITSVGTDAFKKCSNVKKVIVPDIAAWCGIDFANETANPLYYTKKLYQNKTTEITALTIPDKVTHIGSYAFSGCKGLTSVTIPNSVTSIGQYAFQYCSGLPSITIPNSVTSIGDYAFMECSGLTSVTIGNGVTNIGNYAFAGCYGLTSVTIGNSVTSIGNGAFNICNGLTSVTLLCKEIGTWFSGKSSIKEVVIGNEVKSIAQQAFAGCTGLRKVYSKVEDVFTINNNTFATYTYNNAKLYVPVGKKAVYQDTPWWANFTNIEEYDYSTGIAAQQMGKDVKVVDAYQLNGLKHNGVQRGLNIVRMSDGTTRKVVVK